MKKKNEILIVITGAIMLALCSIVRADPVDPSNTNYPKDSFLTQAKVHDFTCSVAKPHKFIPTNGVILHRYCCPKNSPVNECTLKDTLTCQGKKWVFIFAGSASGEKCE